MFISSLHLHLVSCNLRRLRSSLMCDAMGLSCDSTDNVRQIIRTIMHLWCTRWSLVTAVNVESKWSHQAVCIKQKVQFPKSFFHWDQKPTSLEHGIGGLGEAQPSPSPTTTSRVQFRDWPLLGALKQEWFPNVAVKAKRPRHLPSLSYKTRHSCSAQGYLYCVSYEGI